MARVALQLGFQMPPRHRGFLLWELSRRVANYYVIYMPRDTMYRRLYLVINDVRKILDWESMPLEEQYRESWFAITCRRTVVLKDIDYSKWRNRWLPKYDLELVSVDRDHYIYVEGMTRKKVKKWSKKHSIEEKWKIYADHQMKGIRADQPGWAEHHPAYKRREGGR